jgi:hypothetical protein
MTYVQWPFDVNTKFFSAVAKPEDNTITTEYTSGRKVTILKNTRFTFDIECSLGVTSSERESFWKWFTDTLGGCAGIFSCPALQRTSTSTEYFRFKEVPEESEGQKNRVLSLSVEEVY